MQARSLRTARVASVLLGVCQFIIGLLAAAPSLAAEPPGNAPPAVVASPSSPVPYAAIIDKAAARLGVDPRLVRAVIQVESGFQATALSPQGAMGLMQLMPGTVKRYAVVDPFDPRANVEAGIRHLKSLLDRFDLSLALAAYHAGETAVDRFGGMPPYRETRTYVSQVLRLMSGSTPD
ncbi:MAG TPA: lytic transglycosylase domain-containing protein [Vicinamibacterales bacterium]|jgi:soluble lytic murein transglycosylase-like protein